MNDRAANAWRLGALASAQIVAWGVCYYAILVLAPLIADDEGWTEPAVFGAVTAGLLASAGCAIPVGRWLDRRPRRVMMAGTVLASAGLAAASVAPTPWALSLAWVLCGMGQSAILYQSAFTVITHRYETGRRGALTVVTLAGGLASTIFAPLTAWIATELGWRPTLLVLSGVVLAVVLPAYAFTIERQWSPRPGSRFPETAPAHLVRSARLWRLVAAFTVISFSLYAVTLAAVPAALEKGLGIEDAGWLLGLIGVGQVLGRLAFLLFPRLPTNWSGPPAIGAVGSVALTVWVAAQHPLSLIGAALLVGSVRGALTLAQATAVSDRWGTSSYGQLNGYIVTPVAAATALAPGAAALLASAFGSYTAMGIAAAVACVVGALVAVRA